MAHNNLPNQPDQMDKFTRAVKTIVSVPKSAVGKPFDNRKYRKMFKVTKDYIECTYCGEHISAADAEKHLHNSKK